ncbi:MAG TPA: K(+)-transporting ATPase subunit C [Actinomycetota bacterium]|nr:K(+)-transporting ATPase subunit C [Actinomycetota bacterium]
MRRQLVPALRVTIVLTILLGLGYPLVMTGLAQALFSSQANGSLITVNGAVVGSTLLGQEFTDPRYFHPRPSAAGASGYDALASGASNLGPSSSTLLADVDQRVTAYRAENGLPANAPVPVDAVTASGSGLDPEISIANADDQGPRVAQARGVSLEAVMGLVKANTEGRSLGIFGEPGVNVLTLNLALDRTWRA